MPEERVARICPSCGSEMVGRETETDHETHSDWRCSCGWISTSSSIGTTVHFEMRRIDDEP